LPSTTKGGSLRPKLLDLCCCAGAASRGYDDAGFDVTGIDIVERENYPFRFVQADAVEYLREHSGEYDAIHASPPCQKKCALNKGTNKVRNFQYPDLYQPIKDAIQKTGLPAVIENPESIPHVVLCGEMFGLGVLRHRKFELIGWGMERPAHKKHRGLTRGWRHGKWQEGPYIAAYGKGGGKGSVKEMQEAMGINWTDVHEELTEAIPPAYTRYIGERLFSHVLKLNA
jgi:DNA (cytosine-5)-methyltransferase 1